jgi:hypothetical protein
MKNDTPSYRGCRFPPEIISHAVWLYHRFCLSFRDIEDLLAERGIVVSYEAIRQWCLKFGPEYARTLVSGEAPRPHRRRPRTLLCDFSRTQTQTPRRRCNLRGSTGRPVHCFVAVNAHEPAVLHNGDHPDALVRHGAGRLHRGVGLRPPAPLDSGACTSGTGWNTQTLPQVRFGACLC